MYEKHLKKDNEKARIDFAQAMETALEEKHKNMREQWPKLPLLDQ